MSEEETKYTFQDAEESSFVESEVQKEEETTKSTQDNEIHEEEIKAKSNDDNTNDSSSTPSSSTSSTSSKSSTTTFNKWWKNTGASLVEKGFSKNTIIVRAANDLSSLTDVEHSSIVRALNKDINDMSTHDVCKEVSKL